MSYYTHPDCKKCEKPLVAMHNRRLNGKNMDDWPMRRYHKKCWLKIWKTLPEDDIERIDYQLYLDVTKQTKKALKQQLLKDKIEKKEETDNIFKNEMYYSRNTQYQMKFKEESLQKNIYFTELRDYERSYLDVDVKTRKFKQESV